MQPRVLFCLTVLSLPLASLAQPPKARLAAAAVAKPSGSGSKAGLITSEADGKDLTFVTEAFDLGKALEYLSAEAAKATTSQIQGLPGDLAPTLATNSAVVGTVAEMHGIPAPTESPTKRRLAEKLEKLSGAKREKVLLDLFMEVDERMAVTYDLGRRSLDPTISKFAQQAFPQMQEHLFVVQRLAGMAPRRAASSAAAEVKLEPLPAKPKAVQTEPKLEPIGEAPREEVAPKKLESDSKGVRRPSFRMNVKPPTE
jgi:hypothetical protein